MKCYICGWEDETELISDRDYGDKELVYCPRCGAYEISGTVKATLPYTGADLQLSAYLRDWNLLTGKPAQLNSNNIEAIRESTPWYSTSEKMKRLLGSLAAMSSYPGDELNLELERDMVLAWAENPREFDYYLKSLVDRGLLKPLAKWTFDGPPLLILSPEAWDTVESGPGVDLDSAQVFVAMSFSDNMRSLYTDAIQPALDGVGYRAYRVDHEPHIERIDAKIISEIKKSRFLVADVTDQKAGVYYEAGYAHGLGIPVIWTVRKDDLKNVHFDTRQYAHIVWKDAAHLREELGPLIEAVIGRGTRA